MTTKLMQGLAWCRHCGKGIVTAMRSASEFEKQLDRVRAVTGAQLDHGPPQCCGEMMDTAPVVIHPTQQAARDWVEDWVGPIRGRSDLHRAVEAAVAHLTEARALAMDHVAAAALEYFGLEPARDRHRITWETCGSVTDLLVDGRLFGRVRLDVGGCTVQLFATPRDLRP